MTEARCFKFVMPSSRAKYHNKGYCTKLAQVAAARKDAYQCSIKKSNIKVKNFNLHKYYINITSPLEGVFSSNNKCL